MADPAAILDLAWQRALASLEQPLIAEAQIVTRVRLVCRSSNRATTRLLLACALAKAYDPALDIRKPYTQIGDADAYSGRTYDERDVEPFIHRHDLPCNPTTAFLTPALRNRNTTLTPHLNLEGRPKAAYDAALHLLDDVHTHRISATDLLAEVIRSLLIFKQERQQQLETLKAGLALTGDDLPPLSSEGIVTLMQQHLSSPRASRLPVLVVAAAYQTISAQLGEKLLPLHGHTAADKQTGALGDLEIALRDDDAVVTAYEMKARRVTRVDIDNALNKLATHEARIDNYIFITTDVIDDDVRTYARSLYAETGIEFAILDCIAFLRHFLHLFHRLRGQFLDAYQALMLAEPESAVRQELKATWLTLRQAAESGD